MNSFVAFFLNPNQYFQDLNDRKIRKYLLKLLFVYTIIYSVYTLQIGPHKNSNIKSVFDKAAIDLIYYFFLDIVLILFVSAIILVIARIMRTKISFIQILLCIFSLKTLDVLFMVIQLLLFNIFSNIRLLKLVDGLFLIAFLFYLYFPIKRIFKKSIGKTIIIQSISFLGYLTFYFTISVLHFQYRAAPETSKVVEYLSHHEIAEAINESDSLINKYPNDANLRFRIGEAFAMYLLLNPETTLMEGKTKNNVYRNIFSQAEKFYTSAFKLEPTFAEARRSLGDLYYLDGESKKAIEQYAVAIEEGLSSTDIYRKMAISYFRLGNQKKAQKYYNLIPKKNKIEIPKNKLLKISIQDILGQDLEIDAEAILEWHVTNEMQYDLSSGDDEIAKLWIKAGLSLALNKIMLVDYENRSSSVDFLNNSISTIVADANLFFEDKKYGIRIANLKIRR